MEWAEWAECPVPVPAGGNPPAASAAAAATTHSRPASLCAPWPHSPCARTTAARLAGRLVKNTGAAEAAARPRRAELRLLLRRALGAPAH